MPDSLRPQLLQLLSPEEGQRAARFRLDRHRHGYEAAHALKRLMLTAATGGKVHPATWRFESGAHGKPRVASGTGPRFNLSHCDGIVACAVSHDVELGIDVENLDRRVPADLATACFAPEETAWLRHLPAAEMPMGFFRLWTLKEAYLKATGSGITRRLDSFAFELEPLRVAFFDSALGDPAVWRFEQHLIGPRHVLALAWQAVETEMVVELAEVRLETLLERVS